MDCSRLRHEHFEEIEFIAVGIRQTCHAGLFYRDEDTGLRYLHLGWHYDLQNTDPDPQDAWVEPQIRRSRALVFARLCKKIWLWSLNGGRIPFAFSHPGTSQFDVESGALSLCDGAIGLTCAEFVRAVLRSHGVEVVDTANWIVRPADVVRQEWAIGEMKRQIETAERTGRWTPKTPTREHLEAVILRKKEIRVRPEEVAGACLTFTVTKGPRDMCKAETAGVLVMHCLERRSV